MISFREPAGQARPGPPRPRSPRGLCFRGSMRDRCRQFQLRLRAAWAWAGIALFASAGTLTAQEGAAVSAAAPADVAVPTGSSPGVVHLRLRSIVHPVAQQFLVEA